MELETTRSSRRSVVVEWEMAVGVGIATAWGDMSWIQNVGVDELHFGSNAFVPVRMALLNVFTPEIGAFE